MGTRMFSFATLSDACGTRHCRDGLGNPAGGVARGTGWWAGLHRKLCPVSWHVRQRYRQQSPLIHKNLRTQPSRLSHISADSPSRVSWSHHSRFGDMPLQPLAVSHIQATIYPGTQYEQKLAQSCSFGLRCASTARSPIIEGKNANEGRFYRCR